MKVIKSGECIVGIVGTATSMTDLMGKDLFVGDLVRLFLFDEDSRISVDHGLTYVADGDFDTYSDGSVSCNGVCKPFIMGISSCKLGDIQDHGGYWHVKKVKRYNLKKERVGWCNPHHTQEIDMPKSFFKGYF